MHQVLIEVLDENGHVVKNADAALHVEVKGAARLIGLENGDNRDMSQHRSNETRVTTGRVVAYVERYDLGDITIEATMDCCQSDIMTMKTPLFMRRLPQTKCKQDSVLIGRID